MVAQLCAYIKITELYALKGQILWCVNCVSVKLLGFLGGSVVKNLPANAGDLGSIPGRTTLWRSPEEGMETHPSILAWEIPWTEEPGGLESMGSQKSQMWPSDLAQKLFGGKKKTKNFD